MIACANGCFIFGALIYLMQVGDQEDISQNLELTQCFVSLEA
jgi:hypothetical protein